jgi:flagellar assembly protein FliH
MATIIRATIPPESLQGEPVNFDDLAARSDQYLAAVKEEAERLVEEARQEVDSIRRRAEADGHQAAILSVQRTVAEQVAPAITAVRQAATDLQHSRQAWLSHWESSAVHLAAAIAGRIVRGEVRRQPEITLTLVREALELATGSPNVRLHLNPDDYRLLGAEVRSLIDSMSAVGDAEVLADAAVSRGGCRVETRFGEIDQQFESQLNRIEEELTG